MSIGLGAVMFLGIASACKSSGQDGNNWTYELKERPESLEQLPVGLDVYTQFDAMPMINTEAYTFGDSCYRRDGDNEWSGLNQFLYTDENGDQVIYDEKGKGVVTHIWTTGQYLESPSNNLPSDNDIIKIYVDNPDVPVIEMTYKEFTAEKKAPFTDPFTKNWSESGGGRNTYLPIVYEKSCKIAVTTHAQSNNLWWYVDAQKLSPDYDVTAFSASMNTAEAADVLSSCGLDPKSGKGVRRMSDTFSVEAGKSVTFFELEGKKSLSSIKFTLEGLSLPEEYNNTVTNFREELNSLWIKIYWDGNPEASVEAPFGAFFGVGGLGYNTETKALFYGVDENGVLYNYFPMPFEKSAKIVVENRGTETIEDLLCEVRYKEVDYNFYNVGYFTTEYRDFYVPAYDPFEVALLDVEGSGKIVSVQETIFGEPNCDVWYEEGNARFYFDGLESPSVRSPGKEDFYNGAGYFLSNTNVAREGFNSNAFSGYNSWYRTNIEGEGYANAISVHRTFPEGMSFRSEAKFCFQHGGGERVFNEIRQLPTNQSVGYETLVCYYYQPVSRLKTTDSFSVTGEDAASHGYEVTGKTGQTEAKSGFYGGKDIVKWDYEYISHKGTSKFTMKLDPDNYGALLYRTFDVSVGRQGAEVYVDGVKIGEWYTATENTSLSLADECFILPESATKGKSSVEIEIRSNTDTAWTEVSYSIACLHDSLIDENGTELSEAEVYRFRAGGKWLDVSSDEPWTENAQDDPVSIVDRAGLSSDFRVVDCGFGQYAILGAQCGNYLVPGENDTVIRKLYSERADTAVGLGSDALWTIERSGGGWIFKNCSTGKYLSVSGNQVKLSDKATVFTAETVAERQTLVY